MIDWSDIDSLRRLGRPLQRVDLGALDGHGREIEDLVASHVTWRGASLALARMTRATFVDCDLRGADFRGATLDTCSFTRCDLGGAQWEGAQVSQSAFTACDLGHGAWPKATISLTVFAQSELGQASFCGATLHRSVLTDCRIEGLVLGGATLEQCVMAEVDFRVAELNGMVALGSVFNKGIFDGMRLDGIRMDRCMLDGARFVGGSLRGASLREANCRQARFASCDVGQVDATRALLLETTFEDVDARGMICEEALWQSARLRRVRLDNARATASVWDLATFDEVAFVDADLAYARLDHVMGTGVDLRRADLRNASTHNLRLHDVLDTGARRAGMRGTSPSRLDAEARSLAMEHS